MSPTVWREGDIWVMTWTTTDPDTKEACDPATLTAKVYKPDGSSETVAVTKKSSGVYRARVSLTTNVAGAAVGEWESVLDTTGTFQGTKPGRIRVQPKRLGP
jgi:uncharacterized protein YfaS (alpha-2-macroglobulin family)